MEQCVVPSAQGPEHRRGDLALLHSQKSHWKHRLRGRKGSSSSPRNGLGSNGALIPGLSTAPATQEVLNSHRMTKGKNGVSERT